MKRKIIIVLLILPIFGINLNAGVGKCEMTCPNPEQTVISEDGCTFCEYFTDYFRYQKNGDWGTKYCPQPEPE